jgi:hypothetical protein
MRCIRTSSNGTPATSRLGPLPIGTLPRLGAVIAVLALCACLPASAGAAETATLHTSFTPDRLGAPTTIGFEFDIAGSEGVLPPALEGMSLHLPPGIDYLRTTLGLAICNPAALAAGGPSACPPNSRIGSGSAYVEVPFGQGAGHEIPTIEALRGPSHDGNMVVLFYANGQAPVYAQLVFQGELVQGSQTLGGSLDTAIPLIPSVPGGPPVSIVHVQATIGPSGLIYTERAHGRTISFHPRGVEVPPSCPRGGFPFVANFTFVDGSTTTAQSTVPCPPPVPRRRRK